MKRRKRSRSPVNVRRGWQGIEQGGLIQFLTLRVEAIDIHQDGAPNVDHKHKDNETGEKSGKHEACSVGPPYRPGGKGLVTLWVGRRRNFQELTPDDVETPSLKRSKANATKFRSDGFSRL